MTIRNLFFVAALFNILVWVPSISISEEAWESSIGVSLLDMNYKEFDETGFLLDREDGLLPGVVAEVKIPGETFNSSFYFSYHASTIDYDGQTQGPSPIPVKTETETDIIDIQYRLSEKRRTANTFYGGLGYRFWRRNIFPTTAGAINVGGLLEYYTWFYGLLGLRTEIYNKPGSQLALDLRLTHMLKADIDIDFLGFRGCPDTSLDLGKKTNFRVSLPWKIKSPNSYTWVVEPYFEQWDIGRSNTEVIFCPIGGLHGITEPRSETRNFGVNIQMVIPF